MNRPPKTERTGEVLSEEPRESVPDEDARAREANAKSLRQQIQTLKGRAPRSFNEFVQQKMDDDINSERSRD